MDLNIFLWLVGIGVLPAVGFGVFMVNAVKEMKIDIKKLLEMHEHADQYGFGTVGLTKVMNRLADATEDMVHYSKWLAQHLTGEEPAPPVRKI